MMMVKLFCNVIVNKNHDYSVKMTIYIFS